MKYFKLFILLSFITFNVFPEGRAIALVIGIEDYSNLSNYKNLNFTKSEIKAVSKVLKKQGFEVILLSSKEKTTKKYIEEQIYIISDLSTNTTKEDYIERFVFYFTGHGEKSNNPNSTYYLIPYIDPDTNYRQGSITYYDLERYSKELSSIRHQLFIIDSCFSADILSYKNSLNKENINKYHKYFTRQILTASNSNQKSADKKINSFCDFFISAISNDQTDTNKDSYITPNEILSYLNSKESLIGSSPILGDLNNTHNPNGSFYFKSENKPYDNKKNTLTRYKSSSNTSLFSLRTKLDDNILLQLINEDTREKYNIATGELESLTPGKYIVTSKDPDYITKTESIYIKTSNEKIEYFIEIQKKFCDVNIDVYLSEHLKKISNSNVQIEINGQLYDNNINTRLKRGIYSLTISEKYHKTIYTTINLLNRDNYNKNFKLEPNYSIINIKTRGVECYILANNKEVGLTNDSIVLPNGLYKFVIKPLNTMFSDYVFEKPVTLKNANMNYTISLNRKVSIINIKWDDPNIIGNEFTLENEHDLFNGHIGKNISIPFSQYTFKSNVSFNNENIDIIEEIQINESEKELTIPIIEYTQYYKDIIDFENKLSIASSLSDYSMLEKDLAKCKEYLIANNLFQSENQHLNLYTKLNNRFYLNLDIFKQQQILKKNSFNKKLEIAGHTSAIVLVISSLVLGSLAYSESVNYYNNSKNYNNSITSCNAESYYNKAIRCKELSDNFFTLSVSTGLLSLITEVLTLIFNNNSKERIQN